VTIALFHSMFGLRTVERDAAERLRATGHDVVTPDLFGGAVAAPGRQPAVPDGLALMAEVGWETIVARARAAVRDLPAPTVLVGLSMGVGVVGSLWPERPGASAAILLHAPTSVPAGVRPGTPVHTHIAEGDPFAPADQLEALRDSAALAGAEATLFTYPGAGHFFTDPESADYAPQAAEQAWRRVTELLETRAPGSSVTGTPR
jgi:dienelactone hydrolase